MEQIKSPHTVELDVIVGRLETDRQKGLSEEEVDHRLREYGENRLKTQKPKHFLLILMEQFLDPVIYVLGVAAILAFVFNEWIEGIAVVVVILITALIGFLMEWQALRSMEALRKMAQTVSRVVRGGQEKEVRAHELVPGDLLLLEAGDVVPADGRVIDHENLAVKESALTGESTQVTKSTGRLSEDTPVTDQSNMVFKGTLVTRGTARVVLTATGEETQLGQIGKMTREAGKEDTPLEKKLGVLSRRLIWLTVILAAIIALSGYLQGKDLLLMVETGIALAVAAIPEGLPIVATIALARGMLRLARKSVIIKKLESVQTLGETGIICTDKTGTLTENKMVVRTIVLPDQTFSELDKEGQPAQAEEEGRKGLEKIVQVGVLCNNVTPGDGEMKGDPVEVALVEFAQKAGFSVDGIREAYPEELELPFDTEVKMMATVNRDGEEFLVCVKGALENVLGHCKRVWHPEGPSDLHNRKHWMEQADQLAAKGLRTLSFAYREEPDRPEKEELFRDLTFLGVIGFLDPARKDVKAVMETYHKAGVKVVMVTGDHPQTARKIAEEVGLIDQNSGEDLVVHGKDLLPEEDLSPEQEKRLMQATVFARVTPAQKLELVGLYQKNRSIVGMTGDGVNDAPALKKADIGIAMGIRGTEAAKEVADVILKDDQFTSIELAIRQGRTIFENIRKFVVYLMSSNLAEIISVAGASLSNLPLPLLPLQILFLNLVTDVFPALALGMGEGEKDIMNKPPRDPSEPIMTRRHWITTIVYGLSITAGVVGITLYAHLFRAYPDAQVNNMAFYTLVLAQLLNVLNLPGRHYSFFVNDVTRNGWVWGAILLCIGIIVLAYLIPPLRAVLSLVPLNLHQIGMVGLFSLASLALAQLIKRLGGTL